MANDPEQAYQHCCDKVGLSLSEQRERLLDMIDELIGMMIEKACPESKLPEDWSLSELGKAYRDQFGIEATGIQDIVDKQALAEKMYNDAEAVILKKEEELGPENYLRLFRNFFLREIDKQWIEHLQAMDHLRDGIGLRGYGQRKPELEYKREGYDMFVEMVNGIKGVVARQIVTVAQASEEDLQQLEAQRRREAEKRQSECEELTLVRARAQRSRRVAAAAAVVCRHLGAWLQVWRKALRIKRRQLRKRRFAVKSRRWAETTLVLVEAARNIRSAVGERGLDWRQNRDAAPGSWLSVFRRKSGIKESGALDLGLIYAQDGAVSAGVYTRNEVRAAPVVVCEERSRTGLASAVLVNSGNANACTGRAGHRVTVSTTAALAGLFG